MNFKREVLSAKVTSPGTAIFLRRADIAYIGAYGHAARPVSDIDAKLHGKSHHQDDPRDCHNRQRCGRVPTEASMSTIDSMQQNPGEWFPVSLDEVSTVTLDLERCGIPVDPDWPELLRTAKELGFKTQASLQDGRIYVQVIWPDGRATIYESTLVGNVLMTEELR
jgi:hypothetical protein